MQTGLKVLIIEDRRENIVFLANNILKPKGFDVITAMDGESGLRKALEEQPDIIITDLKLPRMHGLEVLADLHDRGSTIPAIVMTFHGSEETAIRAFRLGAVDYLIKPFKMEEIEEALERAIARRNAMAGGVNESLRQRARELEQRVMELESALQSRQETSPGEESSAAVQELQQQVQTLQAELDASRQECAELNELLARQKELTAEARNSAKAMVQFIRQQQKELARQQQIITHLKGQAETLAHNLAEFEAACEAQAHHFPPVLGSS